MGLRLQHTYSRGGCKITQPRALIFQHFQHIVEDHVVLYILQICKDILNPAQRRRGVQLGWNKVGKNPAAMSVVGWGQFPRIRRLTVCQPC